MAPSSRWGVTFGLGNEGQTPLDRSTGRANPSSAGAFYQVSPGVRVGGAVTLREPANQSRERRAKGEREPGVKVESAFQF